MNEKLTNREAVVDELYKLVDRLTAVANENGETRVPWWWATNVILLRIAELSDTDLQKVVENIKRMQD